MFFFFCVLHIFQKFPFTLGEKSKSVCFSRVYVCLKAKLTLVSFFLLFFLCTFPWVAKSKKASKQESVCWIGIVVKHYFVDFVLWRGGVDQINNYFFESKAKDHLLQTQSVVFFRRTNIFNIFNKHLYLGFWIQSL